MKFKFRILLTTLLLCLLSFNVYATDNYIKDNAGVLSSSTLNQVNKNFSKLETNTKAQVKIFIVKSLNGKNINDFTSNLIKTSTKGDRYAIFVVSIKDHKNKFVVGSGLNAVFNKSKIQEIVSLPNPYFKKRDFNTGILKVGQAIDKSITSKAIKSGEAKVVDNGLSKTVEPETSHTGLIIFLITVFVIIIFIIYSLKKKSDRDIKNLARRHGLDDFQNNNSSFKSSNLSNGSTNFNNPPHEPHYDSPYEPPYRRADERYYPNSRHDRGDFVKGMVVGGLVTHGIHEALDHHHTAYTTNSYEDDTELTSGDWDSSEGTSDWGDDYDSSDYDSSGDYDSSNCGDDSSSDYDSSDWGDDSSSDWENDSSDW